MKTFYLKLLTIIIVLIGIYLSVTYYLGYTQSKNFQIINERQSVIIQLPNTEYIEIASRNDHINNNADFSENPFSVNSKIQKNSNLENSIVRTNTYLEYIENGENSSRQILLRPINSKEIDIEIIAETAYLYEKNLKYNIQLDYSNKTEYKLEDGYIYFEDKGCRVEIYDELLDYEITDNKQTVVLSREYDLQIKYEIKMIINCKE
jgi:type II secretory pathway component PulC